MKKSTLAALSLALGLASAHAFANDAAPPAGGPKPEHHFGGPGPFGDADHVITKDEWRKHGEEKFDMIDANHDGKIQPEEMKAHHQAMMGKFKEHHEEWKKEHPGQVKHPSAEGKAPPADTNDRRAFTKEIPGAPVEKK